LDFDLLIQMMNLPDWERSTVDWERLNLKSFHANLFSLVRRFFFHYTPSSLLNRNISLNGVQCKQTPSLHSTVVSQIIDTTVIDSSNDTALAGAYSSQTSPNQHFFGYHLIKSPTKSAQAASRLQSDSRHELDAVKRHLNFSTKQYVSDQVGPQRCPSITPDEDLVRSFNSLSDRLTQALDLASISMFSVVFYSSPACDCGRIPTDSLAKPPPCPHWKLGVVALEQYAPDHLFFI
jgi:hypothetical protein